MVITAEVSKTEAREQAVVTTNARGRVTGFADKPSNPATKVVATEIFVYDTDVLIDALDSIRAERSTAGDLDEGIGDFGDSLLPRLVDRRKVFAHPLRSSWRDVGCPEAYLQSHRDLLAGGVDVIDPPHPPVISRFLERLPARIASGAQCHDVLLSPGCEIFGTVVRSVLGPVLRVDKGAHVEDSVILGGAHIGDGPLSAPPSSTPSTKAPPSGECTNGAVSATNTSPSSARRLQHCRADPDRGRWSS